MTFTEAAVEVLRLVGRPLHYKKITEIAIAKNLLSHVGKAPDMTMSSRLATMIKKDRGEEPIVKVKPGVFALREFDEHVMALADEAFDVDIDALPDVEVSRAADEVADEEDTPEASDHPTPKSYQKLPGAEVFPEEEDDDEPILANLADDDDTDRRDRGRRPGKSERNDGSDDEGGSGRGRRRRRKRRGRSSGPGEPGVGDGSHEAPRSRRPHRERLDMDRAPEEGSPVGGELADAIYAALSSLPRRPVTHARVAELLIGRRRLVGSPSSLAPTVAAAVRADGLRRGHLGARFRQVDGQLALTEWYLPRSVSATEREARQAAERQRTLVHRAFLRKLEELPTAGFAELIATWLNAEGISSLRAVRRPGSSGVELHLAGTLRRGHEEIGVALLILRDGRELEPERIVEVRGALHHYGNASCAWVVTTGRVGRRAREEVQVAGAPPCVLYDGEALAEAMESRGVGLRAVAVPLAAIDLSLLDALRGEPESLEEDELDDGEETRSKRRGKKRRKRRERSGDRDEVEMSEDLDTQDLDTQDAQDWNGQDEDPSNWDAKDVDTQDLDAQDWDAEDWVDESEARAEELRGDDDEVAEGRTDASAGPPSRRRRQRGRRRRPSEGGFEPERSPDDETADRALRWDRGSVDEGSSSSPAGNDDIPSRAERTRSTVASGGASEISAEGEAADRREPVAE